MSLDTNTGLTLRQTLSTGTKCVEIDRDAWAQRYLFISSYPLGNVYFFQTSSLVDWDVDFISASQTFTAAADFGNSTLVGERIATCFFGDYPMVVVSARDVGNTYIKMFDGLSWHASSIAISLPQASEEAGIALSVSGYRTDRHLAIGDYDTGNGSVSVYDMTSNTTWSLKQTISAPTPGENFGFSASIVADTNTFDTVILAVGAPLGDKVYVYNSTTYSSVNLSLVLTITPAALGLTVSPLISVLYFGGSVCLSAQAVTTYLDLDSVTLGVGIPLDSQTETHGGNIAVYHLTSSGSSSSLLSVADPVIAEDTLIGYGLQVARVDRGTDGTTARLIAGGYTAAGNVACWIGEYDKWDDTWSWNIFDTGQSAVLTFCGLSYDSSHNGQLLALSDVNSSEVDIYIWEGTTSSTVFAEDNGSVVTLGGTVTDFGPWQRTWTVPACVAIEGTTASLSAVVCHGTVTGISSMIQFYSGTSSSITLEEHIVESTGYHGACVRIVGSGGNYLSVTNGFSPGILIHRHSSGTWSEVFTGAALTNRSSYHSVDIIGDYELSSVVVGDYQFSAGDGRVTLYSTSDGTTWTSRQNLSAPVGASSFGISVAMIGSRIAATDEFTWGVLAVAANDDVYIFEGPDAGDAKTFDSTEVATISPPANYSTPVSYTLASPEGFGHNGLALLTDNGTNFLLFISDASAFAGNGSVAVYSSSSVDLSTWNKISDIRVVGKTGLSLPYGSKGVGGTYANPKVIMVNDDGSEMYLFSSSNSGSSWTLEETITTTGSDNFSPGMNSDGTLLTLTAPNQVSRGMIQTAAWDAITLFFGGGETTGMFRGPIVL